MNNYTNISTRTATMAAIAAGVVIMVFGILSIADPQSANNTTVGFEHVILAGLTATLLLLVPVILYFGRLVNRPRAALLAVTGQVALAALTVTSNVRGEDPAFFAAVAAPSNLFIVAGFTMLAIGLKRAGAFPKGLAIALPVSWVLTLAGGAILAPVAGAYWLALGWMLHHGELPRPAVATPEPAS